MDIDHDLRLFKKSPIYTEVLILKSDVGFIDSFKCIGLFRLRPSTVVKCYTALLDLGECRVVRIVDERYTECLFDPLPNLNNMSLMGGGGNIEWFVEESVNNWVQKTVAIR